MVSVTYESEVTWAITASHHTDIPGSEPTNTINAYSFLDYSHIGLIGHKRALNTRREASQERGIYKVKKSDKNVRHRYFYNDAYLL